MIFNFTDNPKCEDVKLEQIKGNTVIDIEHITFRKSSARNIEDILRNGVSGNNQELVIDEIILTQLSHQHSW